MPGDASACRNLQEFAKIEIYFIYYKIVFVSVCQKLPVLVEICKKNFIIEDYITHNHKHLY